MAGPNTLPYGDTVEYPTWYAGRSTRLYVKNPDKQFPGRVTVWAGDDSEDVLVIGGKTNHIDRYWGGVEIYVSNTGGPTLTTWTE